MRTAVLSDIHANLEALEAVLRAIRDRGADRWVCLGDTVGYGADPAACLQLTVAGAAVVLQGNHDAAVAGLLDEEYFSDCALQAVRWTRQTLSAAHVAVLRDLPLRHVEAEACYVHAEPAVPAAWGYVCDAGDAAAALRSCAQRLVFVGHSHEAFVCEGTPGGADLVLPVTGRLRLAAGGRYLVNAGSVGQPRDGDPRACFALYDDVDGTVELVRVDYDIATAGDKIRDAGLPGFLALRLTHGC